MATWMGAVGVELELPANHLLKRLKVGVRHFADETTLPMLAPGTGKKTNAYFSAYARDDWQFGVKTIRQWSSIVLSIAGPQDAPARILAIIAAVCRWMAMGPIPFERFTQR